MLVRGHGPDGDSTVVDEELVAGVLGQATADPHSVVFGRDPAALRALVHGPTAADRVVDALVRTGPFGDGFGADRDGLTLRRMLEHPHGIDFGPLEPRLPEVLQTPSRRVELAPPQVLDALASVLTIADQPDELVLIGRRDLRSNNSWMHNVPVLMKGKPRCTLLIHPLDAEARGLSSGDVARICSSTGQVESPVAITDDVMPGVVCLPHGWGHDAEGSRLSVASATPGVNMNRLVDGTVLEPLSGNARLNGIPVLVDALASATT
jgi:hypothetical protein